STHKGQVEQPAAADTLQRTLRVHFWARLGRSVRPLMTSLEESAMPTTADSRQYATNPGDASLYEAGSAEFMRRSNVRRQAAASIAALLLDAVQPVNAITRILDLGCNDGVMTSLYLSALMQSASAQELHVTLVDPAAEALGQAATCI